MKKQKVIFLIILSLFFAGSAYTQTNQPGIIAHKGAWKKADLPKNSIASLKEAIKLGCYGSEFDVHLTKDEVLVINHDPDFMGIPIETSTYKELRAKKKKNGEYIATVEDYLKVGVKQQKTKLILEIKTSQKGKKRTLTLTKKVVELVHKLKAHEHVKYICFDFDAGAYVHQLDKAAKIAYLQGDKTPAEVKEAGYTGLDYHFSVYEKKPGYIQKAHELGLTVNAWTVDKEKMMKKMIAAQVDYITTNKPDELTSLLQK